jgi:hypothetical protein
MDGSEGVWDVNWSMRNMNTKPVSREKAILDVGREVGWWLDILSIPLYSNIKVVFT